jgi:hypothetical protein
MTYARLQAELEAGVTTFGAESVRALMGELEAARAARSGSVPDALCTLLDYVQAPEIQDALMRDALGAKPLPGGGYVLRVKGRDVTFSAPAYMWLWDDESA